MVYIVENNGVYGLTKGQFSATADRGSKSKRGVTNTDNSIDLVAMPPDDAKKQPADADRQMFVDWLAKIKFLSPKDPGLFVIRRLTKTEYANTLHALPDCAAIGGKLPRAVKVGGRGHGDAAQRAARRRPDR